MRRNTDSGSLEVIHFRFYQYNGDESDIELEDMHSTVHHWESDGGGKHTVMHLSLMRFEEQPDVLNLVMGLHEIPETAQE